MTKVKIKITEKKRYPSNYQYRWEDIDDMDNYGYISTSTDGLIDGDYHSEDTYGDLEEYIAEGFGEYTLNEAKQKLENEDYQVVEITFKN